MPIIDFAKFLHDVDLTRYPPTPNECMWKNDLAGHTSRGVLRLANSKKSISPHPELLRWSELTEVRIEIVINLQGILYGVFCLVIAVFIFYNSWIERSITGIGTFTIPFLIGPFGIYFILGARRYTIMVCTQGKWSRWLAPPLKFKASVPLGNALAEQCTQHMVNHRVRLRGWRFQW